VVIEAAEAIVGREHELDVLRDFLARQQGALLLEGEAGIGKTMLFDPVVEEGAASGQRVLRASPGKSEAEISFAALADLLSGLDEFLEALPPPQRHALAVAVRRAEPDDPTGGPLDRGTVAFAFLSLLRALAVVSPVLVAVDDVQWLDAPSASVLSFATRRTAEDRVAWLLARRSAGDEGLPLGLDRASARQRVEILRLGPLSLGALHRILNRRLDESFARPMLRRLHEVSQGNPFFALELGRALQGHPVSAGEELPVPARLHELLHNRLAVLPPATLEVVQIAAALSRPTVSLLEALVGSAPIADAVDADVLRSSDGRVTFTHPLLASSVYSGIEGDRRREIHRRLAEAVTDPEERARHLALSTKGVSAEVASALDDAARSARSRGAPQAAAELSELAFRLTPEHDAEPAYRRRLDAGAAHFESGDTARALTLFADAVESARSAPERAAGLARLAWVNHYAGDQRLAVELFRECLRHAAADAALRIEAHQGLASSLFFLREDLADALSHSRSSARLAKERGDPATLAVALGTRGMIETVLGRPEARRTLRTAVEIEEPALPIPTMRQPSYDVAFARVWSDDLEEACRELEEVRQRAMVQGDESSLPFILSYLSLAECLSGRLERAMRVADEGVEVAVTAGQEIGHAFVCSARALAASCLGLADAARSDAGVALHLAERGTMFAEMTSQWALALLDLALDSPAQAHERLGPLVERLEAAGVGEPCSVRFVTDEVEALVRIGELERARSVLNRHEERAQRLRRRSSLAACARCRGLLANAEGDFGGAVALFGNALESYSVLPLPLERARTMLALGVAQRRANQRRAARESLGEALAVFERLGARLWADRARVELVRIGGRAASTGELTPGEQRIAELVAQGKTNKEVAAILVVADRTVESALTQIYRKLDVRSRTELTRRLTSV